MYTLSLSLLVLFLVCSILLPAMVNDAILFRISKERRRPAERLVPVCVVALFFFAAILFSDLTHVGYIAPVKSNLSEGPFMVVIGLLAIIGGACCIVPFWAMSRFLPALRHNRNELNFDERATNTVNVVGKVFGVLFILISAFLGGFLFG